MPSSGHFYHAVMQAGSAYIDMYRDATSDAEYLGLPSIRVAWMADSNWPVFMLQALTSKALGLSDQDGMIVALPSDMEVVAIDQKLLVSISEFNKMLCDAVSNQITPSSLPISAKSDTACSRNTKESDIQKRLAAQCGGLTEVATGYGRIDILTSTDLIEIKKAAQWKSAIGQILVYAGMYPNHQKRLHLFDVSASFDVEKVEAVCNKFGITLTIE